MTNPYPECPQTDCRFYFGPSMQTLAYYPPIYDKNGVNINPDGNTTSFNVECLTCSKQWRGQTLRGNTTYTLIT